MQGTFEALLTGDKLALTTESLGAFEVANPQLGEYRFSSGLEGSLCTDAVTGATVRFPMSLYVPRASSTAITAISLLTVPAADDSYVPALYNGTASDGRAPAYLWRHAYKLFGYDAGALGVDFMRYVGQALTLGSPTAAALAGSNSQVMATYSSALELIEPLLGSQGSIDDIASSVVKATYDQANAAWSKAGDASPALSNATLMSELYAQGYTAATPLARRRSVRRLHVAPRTAAELKPLFDAVAQVRARARVCMREA